MPLLVLLFIVVPIVELYVIIQIGQLIGLWPTLVLLLADAILGSLLLRQQGRAVWRRFNAALTERRFPGREVADGVMVAVGGTLLLTPGFVTDVVGLLLLIPPTRAAIRRVLFGILRRRFALIEVPASAMRGRSRRGGPYDYEGSAREVPNREPGGEAPGREGPEPPRLPPS